MIVLKKWAKIKTSRTAAFLFGCVGQARQMVVDLCDPHLPPTPTLSHYGVLPSLRSPSYVIS